MLRFFRLQEGWLTVGLLALLLFSVTLSVQQAQWSEGLSILTPITLIGLATGVILAKVRGVPRFLLDVVGLLVGLITVLVAVAGVMRDPRLVTIQDKVQDLLSRTAHWVNVAVRQDMSDDLVVFILSLAVVTWVLAYSSAYFVFKSRQLWWALVPNGVALLINLSYSMVNVRGYIVVFMFSALLLMIRFNLLMKEERWQRERVNYSPHLTWSFLWAGSAVSVVLATLMWFVPTTPVNSTLNGMWERVNGPWVDFQSRMGQLWSQVPGNQNVGGYSSFNRSFTMGGALNLSNAVALMVKSKKGHYWRARTQDQYTGIGWNDTSADTFNIPNLSPRLALAENQKLIPTDAARKEVTYTVQVVSPKRDLLFAPLNPVKLSVESRLEVSWRRLNERYNLDTVYAENGSLSDVPLELRKLAGLAREGQRGLRNAPNLGSTVDPLDQLYGIPGIGSEISQEVDVLRGRGIDAVLDVSEGPDYYVELRASGEVPVYDDISAIYSANDMPRNGQYTAVSLVTEATEDDLRLASADYSKLSWLERYRTLPASMPQNVRDLAGRIVREADATNPYDQARAIERYLRDPSNYRYSTDIAQPPSGMDRVEWFLFESKLGYCEYYASAMIVMLRSLDVPVPSRMATGYAPGTFDPVAEQYVVRESAAHAWPEVYFPGYGWIEFEPTPSQAVISREMTGETDEEPTPEASSVPSPVAIPNTDREDERDPAPIVGGSTGGIDLGAGAAGGALLLLLAVAAALWLPGMPWRKKGFAGSSFYYGKMLLWARLLRIGPAAHQTPYEFSETLAREVPGTSLFARAIARGYVRERFSRDKLDNAERASLNRSWQALRSRLLRRLPARQFGRIFRRK